MHGGDPSVGAASVRDFVHEASHNVVYNAKANTKLVFFGDLEGNSLKEFLNPTNSVPNQTDVLLPSPSKLDDLAPYLKIDPVNGTLVLSPNVVLVFLGDAWGVGPAQVELVSALLDLKMRYPNQVILILGNRDLIRQRLWWELELVGSDNAKLISCVRAFIANPNRVENELSGDFKSCLGITLKFKRNNATDFDYMWDPNPIKIAEMTGCLERIKYVTSSTMGEGDGWKFIVDEFLTKKGIVGNFSENIKALIYLYLVQVMCGAIEDPSIPEFNNIFGRQFEASHLIAAIRTPDRGVFGLMHSLPPRMKIPIEPARIYEEQKDMSPADAKKVKDAEITMATELSPTALLRINMYLNKLHSAAFAVAADATTVAYNAAAYKLLLQFVAGITSGSFDIYLNNEFTGLNAPVSTVSFDKPGFDLLKTTTGQSGGAMAQLKDKVATQYVDIKVFIRIICSHKPQGYVGVKVKFGDQLYYCVDVSKIDEQKYDVKTRYGCCFLVIDLAKPKAEPDDMLIGRIMLSQSQFPSNYNPFEPAINPSPFAQQNAKLFVNYKQSPVVESKLNNWIEGTTAEPRTAGTFPQNMQLTYNGTRYNFSFKNGPNFTKMPLLTAPVAAAPAPLPVADAPLPMADASVPVPVADASVPVADTPLPVPVADTPLPVPMAAAPVPVPMASVPVAGGSRGSRRRKRRHTKKRGRRSIKRAA